MRNDVLSWEILQQVRQERGGKKEKVKEDCEGWCGYVSFVLYNLITSTTQFTRVISGLLKNI